MFPTSPSLTRSRAIPRVSPNIGVFDTQNPLGDWRVILHNHTMIKHMPSIVLSLALAMTAQAATVNYSYDDGMGDTNQGPPSSFSPDMLWLNYFEAQPGGEVITTISAAFGSTWPTGGTVTFWVFEDDDDDFNPDTNSHPVASVTRDVSLLNLGFNVFNDIPVTPTEVKGGFFVGVSCFLTGGQDRPARVDTGARADRSWFYYAPDIKSIANNLTAAPFRSRMDNTQNVIFPGAFMIRATGIPATPPPSCPGDTNGDNAVNSADLSVLLAQFGTSVEAGTGADFNDDGVVNAADLSVLLSNFGSTCS